MSHGTNPGLQGHSRWGNIPLRTISSFSQSFRVSSSEMQSVSFETSSAWSSPVSQNWQASEPPVSTSPALELHMHAATPSLFMWVLELNFSSLTTSSGPLSTVLIKERYPVGGSWPFWDPHALDSMSLPTQCKFDVQGWGGLFGEEGNVGPVVSSESDLPWHF